MQKHGALRCLRKCRLLPGGRRVGTTSDNAGYTLMEMMVALMILAIGVLGVWSMQGVAIRSNATARKVTENAALGADQLEKLMCLPYDDAVLTPGATTSRTEGRYTVTWNVSAPDTPVANIKTVTITASWDEAGQQRSVSYVYYKADQI